MFSLREILIAIALFLGFAGFHYWDRRPASTELPATPLQNIGNANFGDSNVQFTEVTGKNLNCMVALHTKSGQQPGLYASMECVSK